MRKTTAAVAAAAAFVLAAGTATPAQAAITGTRPLATVLTSDGNQFDSNWHDYDIVTEAALAVLDAKPSSKVALLTDGDTPLTAFIPNDRAFRLLVKDLTGSAPSTEAKTFEAVAGLGIDTVETVLLYHVVPQRINARQALASNGDLLTTAQGGTFRVQVVSSRDGKVIKLRDRDYDARNPQVIQTNINRGNQQLAHGIDRVLRPFNL